MNSCTWVQSQHTILVNQVNLGYAHLTDLLQGNRSTMPGETASDQYNLVCILRHDVHTRFTSLYTFANNNINNSCSTEHMPQHEFTGKPDVVKPWIGHITPKPHRCRLPGHFMTVRWWTVPNHKASKAWPCMNVQWPRMCVAQTSAAGLGSDT